jgi:YidC/Oxa1 family membrane protein insertase
MIIAENALFHDIGRIFQPVFDAIGWMLALIYGLIPNYAVAIALLTVLIMVLLTPLTVKSTRSMIAMQALQPEIKKLQTKYKGAENRQKLNEELMALYKEKGINPAGGCLPMFLQMPFLIILYDTIKGLTNAVAVKGANGAIHTEVQPRYIPKPANHATTISLVEKLYHSLVQGGGQMVSFGINLANKPFGHGMSAAQRIPFFVLVALAVGLQYFQMRQMNSRNSQAAANKQMQTIQKVTPILFAYIYFLVPAAVVIYMVISTLIRILTQEVMFRTGMVQPVGAERGIGGAKGRVGSVATTSALVEETDSTPKALPKAPPKTGPKANGAGTSKKPVASNGNRASSSTNGSGGTTNGTTGSKPTVQPRARGKRPRKAR